MLARDEEVRHRERVAAGAAQPGHVPDVHDGGLPGREEHGAAVGGAVRGGAGSSSLDGTVAAEPRGVTAAAGEAPRAVDAVAAVHRDRARVIARAPGQHRARGPEDLARGLRREIGRGHGAAGGLAETPRRARVVLGDLLDDLDERERIHLAAVEEAREEHRNSEASTSAATSGVGSWAIRLDLGRRRPQRAGRGRAPGRRSLLEAPCARSQPDLSSLGSAPSWSAVRGGPFVRSSSKIAGPQFGHKCAGRSTKDAGRDQPGDLSARIARHRRRTRRASP